MKLLIIVGTRPEIIRLAAVIKKTRKYFDVILAHTGQNYDYTLNGVFFHDLELDDPDVYLNAVGSDLGETMGNIIAESYKLMVEIKPDAVLVLGDTNSCLSVIGAKRLHIPIFHAINKMAEKYDMPILYSCHPRSRNRLAASGFVLDKRVIQHEPLGFHDYNCLQMNVFAVVSDSGTLPEESSFFTSVGHAFPAVCIRTSTERPEALDKGSFVLAGIDEKSLLQAVDTAVEMNLDGDNGLPVPDYVDENVSTKVVKIIQSYTGVVNKMVWRKEV